MKTADASKLFGSITRLAKAMNVSVRAVHYWGEYPPIARQYQVEILTNGRLHAERSGPTV
jgi:hypothetical protein